LCILEKKDFRNHIEPNINFIKYLPAYIPYNHGEIRNQLVKKGVTVNDIRRRASFSLWFIYDDKVMNFWICLKELIHNILDDALRRSNLYQEVKDPVIHFRCADTPFVKNVQYHFVKYEFYKNALEKIYKKYPNKEKKVIVLSCNTHRSNEKMKNSCIKYTDFLNDYLKKNKYNPDVKCGSNIMDFATMFYAPGVISIGSSYSFFAGFFGNGMFITTEHVEEKFEKRGCTICNDWMLTGKIKHKDIPDYYDYETVNKMLLE